jgi:hypothetical protein
LARAYAGLLSRNRVFVGVSSANAKSAATLMEETAGWRMMKRTTRAGKVFRVSLIEASNGSAFTIMLRTVSA